MRIRLIAAVSTVALATCGPAVSEAKVVLGDPVPVSEQGSGWPFLAGDVAYDSTSDRYLVAWSAGNQGTFGRILAGTARPLGNQFRISDGGGVRVVRGPAGEFLVLSYERALEGGSRLVGRRLGPGGESRGGPFVVSEQPGHGAAVAYNATQHEYLVAWATDHIHVQRLDPQGAKVGAAGILSAGARDLGVPALAHNTVRNEYLVAWDQQEGDYHWERRVRAQRLDAVGGQVGADDFSVPSVADTLGPQGQGSLRWVWVGDLEHDPVKDRYLLVRTYAGTSIGGRFIDGSGALGEALATGAPGLRLPCCEGEYIVGAPHVSFDVAESQFYWAWSEDLDGSTWLVDTEIFAAPLEGADQVSIFGRGHDPARDADAGVIAYNPRADEHLVVFWGEGQVFARRIGNPPDRRPPVVSVRAPKRQHVLRRGSLILRVRCDENCAVAASARVALSHTSRAFVRANGSLTANKRARVRLKLSRSKARSLRRAMARRRSLPVRVTATAHDRAGNSTVVKRRIYATR